jgi:putative ABC transport system permease protein
MGIRTLRLLLRLLPEEFRAGYGQELVTTYATERARLPRGARAMLWLSTMFDIISRAPALHFDLLRRDTRLAFRSLASRPLATLAAIVMLTVGIGTNLAMLAVMQTVLWSPLPYRESDRLIQVKELSGGGEGSNLGYLTFVDVRGRSQMVGPMAAATQSAVTLTAPDRDAERVGVMRVSREYFRMIDVTPALGRAFTEAEDAPGEARRVVILSDAIWRRRFNADPAVVGTLLTISGTPYRIVGVMPRNFTDMVAQRMYNGAELWTPLGYDPAASFACRTCRHLRVFARLAPDATFGQAEQELHEIMRSLEREHPASYSNAGMQIQALPDVFLGAVRPVLLALWAGVVMLWLVTCGNVAHLTLLRASERNHEVVVRTMLGVTPARLARQFLTEAVVLSSVGGVAALGVAWAMIRVVATNGPADIPRLEGVALTTPLLTAAAAFTVLSAVIFSVLPLRQVLQTTRAHRLGTGARGGTATRSVWRSRAALVSANVALAVVLLVGSGLLVRSLTGLLSVRTGFEASGVLTLELWAGGPRFTTGEQADQVAATVRYYDEVLTGIQALPGVTHAAAVTTLPLGGNIDGYGFHIEGRLLDNPESAPSADRFAVTPDYFETLRIPSVRGRLLNENDRQGGELVAVINDTAARTLFGGDDPIGRRIMLGPPTAAPRTIVGIAADVVHQGLDEPVGAQVYVPQAQWVWAETWMNVVVRTTGDPLAVAESVRSVIRQVDPTQPVARVRRYQDVVDATMGTRRFAATLLTMFAATTLILAIVGLYGSVSVMITQRRRELGVRLALGASTSGVWRLVLTHGLQPVVIGIAGGLGAAALSTSVLASLLYDITPLDALTFGVATATVIGAAVAACLLPAWRAGRIDPAIALRE